MLDSGGLPDGRGLARGSDSINSNTCQNENSLSFKVGVGKMDSKGVEQTWESLNPVAYHTKDTGLGKWADTLEGVINNHNFGG
ncbi:hypothetical protein C8R45DRAFT_834780 [Mycena sanguinolenta]|nr:hypothetical protein C8R45DRAFT_834780 [Mycena sanguinolenta]